MSCQATPVQVWGTGPGGRVLAPDELPPEVKLLSLDEGRAYEVYCVVSVVSIMCTVQVYFPTGTLVSLGPYLSFIKIFASRADRGATVGLCETYDGGSGERVEPGQWRLAHISLLHLLQHELSSVG